MPIDVAYSANAYSGANEPVVVWFDRRQRKVEDGGKSGLPVWAPIAVYAVALLPAFLTIVTMVAAGHSGATLVWHDLGNYVRS